MHALDGGVGGRGGRGGATGVDDGSATLGDGRDEVVLDPGLLDQLAGLLATDLGVEQVGVLGGGVVAPDGHVLDVVDRGIHLAGQLGLGAVVVQTRQGGEVVVGDVGGVGGGDEGVGVGRVSGHQHLDVVSGDLIEGLALSGEDGAVLGQQVGTLHAGLARHGTDEEGGVGAVEDLLGIVADLDVDEVAEGAVVKLHDDALEGLEGRGDLEQTKLDGGVAEQRAGGDAEQQAVADLSGGAGDGNLDRGGAHEVLLGVVDDTCTHDCTRSGSLGARREGICTGVSTKREVG